MADAMSASRQWSSRPADQRFESLHAMAAYCAHQKAHSRAVVCSSRAINFAPAADDQLHGLEVTGPNGHAYAPTHYSFGQLATLAGAPAGYMRSIPAPLAADCLNYGFKIAREVEDVGVLLTRNGGDELRAATGPNYGRVWNADLTAALVERFGDGISGDWRVPGEFGKEVTVTKANTTLFGSDRDMFVFLADEKNRIEVENRRFGQAGSMARGFFVWNSEVGSSTLGAAFFLFDYVCGNRIVWGMEGFNEVRIRHTVGAPDRWLETVVPVLNEYANASAKPVEATIAAAQAKKLNDDVETFLRERFAKSTVRDIVAAHEAEEGRPMETIWDTVTGITAYAKLIPYTNERVALERQAGDLLKLAA